MGRLDGAWDKPRVRLTDEEGIPDGAKDGSSVIEFEGDIDGT